MRGKNLSRPQRLCRATLRSVNRRLSLNDRWLLSFGDMLTLVLCFFICLLVSIDDANQKYRMKAIQDMPSQSRSGRFISSFDETSSGTQLAKDQLEESLTFIVFGEKGFDEHGQTLSPNAARELKSVLDSEDYRKHHVRLGCCSSKDGMHSDSPRLTQVTRLLSLRSQLIDASFETEGLKLDFHGASCSEPVKGSQRVGEGRSLAYLQFTPTQEMTPEGKTE